MHRTAYYNGKPVWSGIVSKLDNSIEEVYPFSTARDKGFHHSFYVIPQGQERMDNGESQFFFITEGKDGKTKVETAWRDDKSDELERALSDLLDLSDDTDYDDDKPEYEHTAENPDSNDDGELNYDQGFEAAKKSEDSTAPAGKSDRYYDGWNDGLFDKSNNTDVSDIAKALTANDIGRSL